MINQSTHITNLVCCMCAGKWECGSQSKTVVQILVLACLIETAVVETSSFILSAVAFQTKQSTDLYWSQKQRNSAEDANFISEKSRQKCIMLPYNAVSFKTAELTWLPYATLLILSYLEPPMFKCLQISKVALCYNKHALGICHQWSTVFHSQYLDIAILFVRFPLIQLLKTSDTTEIVYFNTVCNIYQCIRMHKKGKRFVV